VFAELLDGNQAKNADQGGDDDVLHNALAALSIFPKAAHITS
jgi:hypothetical protein